MVQYTAVFLERIWRWFCGFLSESQDFYRKARISIGKPEFHPYKLYDLVFIDMFSLSARELQQALLFMKSIMFSDFLSEPFNFHRIVFSSDHDYYWSVKWIFIVCSIFIVTYHLTNAHISKICIFEFLSDHFHRFAFLSDFSWDFGVISTVVGRFFLEKNGIL